jgi:circadian clock protein KaiC
LLLMAQHGLVGAGGVQVPVDASYLADTVMLTRYFEAAGQVRQAISVIKKRTGYHERTIREMRFVPNQGIIVGDPLREFEGVLGGTPHYIGPVGPRTTSSDEFVNDAK